MSRLAAAVHVLTTDGPAGRFGATVSAVCSVSDAPPALLVCLNSESSAHDPLIQNGHFCINTLEAGQEPLSNAFAGRGGLTTEQRFDQASWDALTTGAPALIGARINFDCEVLSLTPVGSHTVIVGTVVDVRMENPGDSLLYIRRNYHTLPK
ncbi:MAG: flavin reductase [Rhodobacteraceae bacterium]|nr:flavin reductase [Paracoccaceae bacterium]